MTLPSSICLLNVQGKFEGTAFILKQRLHKMGGGAALGQIRSKMSHGEGQVGFMEGSQEATGSSRSTNQWSTFV
jgi:hypothetical protein